MHMDKTCHREWLGKHLRCHSADMLIITYILGSRPGIYTLCFRIFVEHYFGTTNEWHVQVNIQRMSSGIWSYEIFHWDSTLMQNESAEANRQINAIFIFIFILNLRHLTSPSLTRMDHNWNCSGKCDCFSRHSHARVVKFIIQFLPYTLTEKPNRP